MAGGIIKSAVLTEGFPYFVNETGKQVNFFKLQGQFLARVGNWIAAANALMTSSMVATSRKDQHRQNALRASVFQSHYKNTGSTYSGGFRKTAEGKTWVVGARNSVGSDGSGINEETGSTLRMQWESVVMHNRTVNGYGSQIYDKEYFKQHDLLKQGYRLLTEIGEAIRGDNVTYKVAMRNVGGSGGGFGDVWEYNMNLNKYLDFAATKSNNIFRSDLNLTDSTKKLDSGLGVGMTKSVWTAAMLQSIEVFLSQVRGYIEWHGGGSGPASSKMHAAKHPYAKANKGQILEAFLQSGYITKWLRSPSKDDWKGLIGDYMNMAMGRGEGNTFAAFWQGGEGGTNLADIQVKGRYASITSMSTLVRQMTRVYAFLNRMKPEQFVAEAKENFIASGKMSDEQALEQLIKMFYSEMFLTKNTITLYV